MTFRCRSDHDVLLLLIYLPVSYVRYVSQEATVGSMGMSKERGVGASGGGAGVSRLEQQRATMRGEIQGRGGTGGDPFLHVNERRRVIGRWCVSFSLRVSALSTAAVSATTK